jgi:hypothetical protein
MNNIRESVGQYGNVAIKNYEFRIKIYGSTTNWRGLTFQLFNSSTFQPTLLTFILSTFILSCSLSAKKCR